jgi:protein-disulfide isomerase
VLSVEPDIVANYVETGQVKLVFWPVLNHGDPSIYSTLTAECIAQQDMDAFWEVHEQLFLKQNELWGADRDYYVQTAVETGVDQSAFEACYDGSGLEVVWALDEGRKARGIFNQPYFDINGQLLGGLQSYEVFVQAYQAVLP